jgi:hypothetical protein
MADFNLFTMLSAYRPNSPATPFENYCTSALAYFLRRGHHMLTALLGEAGGARGEPLAMVEVQPQLGDAGVADLVLTFEGGQRVIVEIQIEPGAGERALPVLEALAKEWREPPAYVLLGVPPAAVHAPWQPVTWLQVVEALEDDPDPMAQEFAAFILRDVLGLGDVPLDEAVTTNRLYALGGAAIRRAFGPGARYQNSASRPVGGRFRYLGTTFAPNGSEMKFWIGIVNETVPLSEHYHLTLASTDVPVREPMQRPRATGDWTSWSHWTGAGRVVRPITAEAYLDLLKRLPE